MHNIIKINDATFTYNGVQYPRQFTPVLRGDKIAIYSIYDVNLVLSDFDVYSEYRINGLLMPTPEQTQAAILAATFTKDGGSGGGGGNQDLQSVLSNGNSANIDIEIYDGIRDTQVVISGYDVSVSNYGQTRSVTIDGTGIGTIDSSTHKVIEILPNNNIKLNTVPNGTATRLYGLNSNGEMVTVPNSVSLDRFAFSDFVKPIARTAITADNLWRGINNTTVGNAAYYYGTVTFGTDSEPVITGSLQNCQGTIIPNGNHKLGSGHLSCHYTDPCTFQFIIYKMDVDQTPGSALVTNVRAVVKQTVVPQPYKGFYLPLEINDAYDTPANHISKYVLFTRFTTGNGGYFMPNFNFNFVKNN